MQSLAAERTLVASGNGGHPYPEKVTWKLYSDGEIVFSGEGSITGNYGDLPWKSYLKDIKKLIINEGITSVEFESFANCTNLTNVSLPKTLTKIASYSFENCTSLTGILITSNIKDIAPTAFQGCIKMQSCSVSSENKTFMSKDFVLFKKESNTVAKLYLFPPALYNIKTYKIPETVTDSTGATITVSMIGDNAFQYAQILQSVTIPNTITHIGAYAFESCKALTSVFIPTSVKYIYNYTFANNPVMTSISVDEANTSFSAIDGVLFNKEKTTLLQYPTAKSATSYTIPATVTNLSFGAFAGNTNLQLLTIPKTVTTVPANAFANCTNLKIKGYHGAAETAAKAQNIEFEVLAHEFNTWVTVTESNCTNNGLEQSTCDHCSQTTTRALPKNDNHDFGEGQIVKHATCVSEGEQQHFCTRCGTKATEIIPPTGNHTFGEWVIDAEATCKSAGLKHRTCTVCGKQESEEIPIAINSHKFGEWAVKIPATTQSEGTEERACSVCGITETRTIPQLPQEKIIFKDSASLKIIQTAAIPQGLLFYEQISAAQLLARCETQGLILKDKSGKSLTEKANVGSGATLTLEKDGEVIDSYTVVLLGDADGDGSVTAADARFALRYSVKLEKDVKAWQTLSCDTEGKNNITASDARTILRVSAKLQSFKK